MKRRGWELVDLCEDAGTSGKSMTKRPALAQALQCIEGGEADGLVVAKLDRLSRSLLDFASLMERARRKGWGLVALDLGVDTSTPSGEMLASVLAVFAQFERRLIGERTKAALAVKRTSGTRLGRPPTLPPKLRRRIRALHQAGQSYSAIAVKLNAEGVPTAHGGKCWYPATVRKVAIVPNT